MRLLIAAHIFLSGLISFAISSACADSAELIERMDAGSHILMIRHALAPGTGDPSDFKIGDCTTQRNLDDTGRAQARAIGRWLRKKGVKSARIYSSQWCRCLETAALLDMGPVREMPALNSFYELPQNREPQLRALKKFISEQPTDGELIILVTHFVTISAITGEGVGSGEGVLLKLHENAPYRVIGRLNFGR